ncbi:DUF2793 domain-containing protein [Allosphingosinicella flava]|uniref:DUF2793 domain-containing protein n=1 Tax=Allosphingosinicella flava TaxID=2771430 RepID=A0A7T2GLH8_9SPHN|nr:DUF2793 domain-containing protein [Sphingosinicella flava]QPQ56070.1 DUF2793 domain-containing protein [Sphingosinicella flava]
MTEKSARLNLPFLVPGQAQKEFFHNEALAQIDMMLCAAIEGDALSSPPSAPGIGRSWIVAPSAAGAWSGMEHAVACWTSGGWRFAMPAQGMAVWDKSRSLFRHWNGTAWSSGEWRVSKLIVDGNQVVGARLPPIESPAGGGIVDAEARQAIAAIRAALMSHGLIA